MVKGRLTVSEQFVFLFLLTPEPVQRIELSSGQVMQFHEDQYDKIVGKKLAMVKCWIIWQLE